MFHVLLVAERVERLKGKDAVKYHLYDAITAALKNCLDWQSLRSALGKQGISLSFSKDASGWVKGVCFIDNKHKVSFAGSRIDRSLSYGGICKQMGLAEQAGTVCRPTGSDKLSVTTAQETFMSSEPCSHPEQGSVNGSSPSADAALSSSNDGGDGNNPTGGNIGKAVAELVLQPHVVPTPGGGGGGSPSSWGDEKDKDKNNQRNCRSRRRR